MFCHHLLLIGRHLQDFGGRNKLYSGGVPLSFRSLSNPEDSVRRLPLYLTCGRRNPRRPNSSWVRRRRRRFVWCQLGDRSELFEHVWNGQRGNLRQRPVGQFWRRTFNRRHRASHCSQVELQWNRIKVHHDVRQMVSVSILLERTSCLHYISLIFHLECIHSLEDNGVVTTCRIPTFDPDPPVDFDFNDENHSKIIMKVIF